ncbi:alpha/beta fold hydrolase [Tepidimonas sp. HKU79]|uniref:alpha/beta fold hydrolase n=1 Tax=unclassified Tepidimonas TaxID=2631705 RepID=UPI003C7C3F67
MYRNICATSDPPRENPTPVIWSPPSLLPVGRCHRIAWRGLGAAAGEPWLVLHGGPGSGAQPGLVTPLDLHCQRAIVPDQRGSGASRPRGSTRGNHLQALVADLEALRVHLSLERWAVLAGSWGTVLALAYAQRHPQRVQRLVLRGAFALRWREIGGLLLPTPQTRQRLGNEPFWPIQVGTPLPVALRRLAQVLQTGTLGVAALRVTRRWAVLEAGLAEHGMKRSERLARLDGDLALAAAIHREWAVLHRRLRSAQAQARQPRRLPADHAALRKYRIQVHYLRHRGFVRPGQLDRAVRELTQQGVPIEWVHGRCDAVCPPANSHRWAAVGGRLRLPLAGHLGHEPALVAALRAVVRGGA